MLYGWELLTEPEKSHIAEDIKRRKISGGPFHLALFPTDRCNLNCFFCYTEPLRKDAAELGWDVLKSALEDGIKLGLKGVSFGGGGEPLIYKSLDKLLDFIEMHSLKIDSIKTNGTALTPEVAQRLLGSGLKRITISLNETRADEYAKIARCSTHLFEKAIEGILNIVKAKKESGSDCDISTQVFVWKKNFRRLPDIIMDLLPTGTDYIYVNTMDSLADELRMTGSEKEEFKQILKPVIKKWARHLQFNLSAEGLHQFATNEHYKYYPQAIDLPDICKSPHRVEYCYIGWYAAVIEASGDIYPCCHFTVDRSKSLGNLHSQTLKEIWYGKKARRFRWEMRHLLLTRANPHLLPRMPRFIHPLCLERSACAFNFYLCSPDFYFGLYNWSENSAAKRYRTLQKIKSIPYRTARRVKHLLMNLK